MRIIGFFTFLFFLFSHTAFSQFSPFAFVQKKETSSTSGNFFILSSSAHSPDFGGLEGAHKVCLDHLRANTWKDKATVTLHGGTVWAWLCGANGCSNLQTDTTYTFAKAGSATAGGDTFTTNGSGRGPGNSDDWDTSTRFGSNLNIYTGRSSGSSTLWSTSAASNHCNDWTDDSNDFNGQRGDTGDTGITRWNNGDTLCNNNERYICFVDDDGDSGDKTPTAVDWTDFAITSNTQTLNSFTGHIGLKLIVTDLAGSLILEYQRNSEEWQSFSSAADFEFGVNSGDTLKFRIQSGQTVGLSAQVDVLNVSSGNSTLDTFTVTTSNYGHFFILSNTGHKGDFGGLSGADSTCLDDLKTKTWRGKGGPALTSSTVKAWLCDNSGCNNLSNNTTYTFARMANASIGGATFTTNGSGRGPDNSDDWDIAGRWSVNAHVWTGRNSGTSTLWPTTKHSNHCNSWNDQTDSYTGRIGETNNTDADRWSSVNDDCDNNNRYVCVVSDDGTSDAVPASMDWTDFIGSSSSQSFTSIDVTLDIEVSAVYVTGAPTLEYRKNGGSWTSFTPGSPASISIANTDTLEFRTTGSSTHSADLTISNLTTGGTVLDTVRGTVP